MTVQLEDEALYAAVKAEAVRQKRPLTAIVTEALGDWLEARQDKALGPALTAARADWKERGGTEAGKVFRQLRAAPGASGAVSDTRQAR
jgi:hypothetical protein